jgi:hypothetical protein
MELGLGKKERQGDRLSFVPWPRLPFFPKEADSFDKSVKKLRSNEFRCVRSALVSATQTRSSKSKHRQTIESSG